MQILFGLDHEVLSGSEAIVPSLDLENVVPISIIKCCILRWCWMGKILFWYGIWRYRSHRLDISILYLTPCRGISLGMRSLDHMQCSFLQLWSKVSIYKWSSQKLIIFIHWLMSIIILIIRTMEDFQPRISTDFRSSLEWGLKNAWLARVLVKIIICRNISQIQAKM